MRGAIVTVLCLTLGIVGLFAQTPTGTLNIYYIDTEGGQSTLFVGPTGESLLVDTGNAGDRDLGRIVESGPAAAIYHEPRHPYTMALLRSVPRLDRPRQARLDPVEGQPPDLTRLDGECTTRIVELLSTDPDLRDVRARPACQQLLGQHAGGR